MVYKLILFTILQLIPLFIWYKLALKKEIIIDFRLLASCFIFGTWFGMNGELFLFKIIEWTIDSHIWEYRTLPMHDGIISSYGPIMWGIGGVYVCFHKKYHLNKIPDNRHIITTFLFESMFLLILEVFFNGIGYLIFNDYFFYYFAPDLGHWTSLTNLPFWWVFYQTMMKYSIIMKNNLRLSLCIAIMMIVIAYGY